MVGDEEETLTLEEARDKHDRLIDLRDDLIRSKTSFEQELNILGQNIAKKQGDILTAKTRKMGVQERSRARAGE